MLSITYMSSCLPSWIKRNIGPHLLEQSAQLGLRNNSLGSSAASSSCFTLLILSLCCRYALRQLCHLQVRAAQRTFLPDCQFSSDALPAEKNTRSCLKILKSGHHTDRIKFLARDDMQEKGRDDGHCSSSWGRICSRQLGRGKFGACYSKKANAYRQNQCRQGVRQGRSMS